MRALIIQISGELLLELMGLQPGNIELSAASIEWPNILELTLTGEDERLPEVKDGQSIQSGIVKCERIESSIVVNEEK